MLKTKTSIVADLGLDLAEQFQHLLLVARVGAEGMDLAALPGDLRPPGASACRRCAASPRRYNLRARSGGRSRRPSHRPRRSRRRPCLSPWLFSFHPVRRRAICRREGGRSREIKSCHRERGRLSRGGGNEAGAPADLGGRQAFAVGAPARRGEQIHPDFAQRARRAQVLEKADPGLEVDDQDVVRRLGMARSGRSRSGTSARSAI